MKVGLITVYLAAIVAANWSVTHWGPEASVYNAFLFIGLDLTTRDRLHSIWRKHLARNMAALIAAGSLLSYLVNRDSGRIALASCVAFAAAATVDAIVYQWRRHRPWLERANESNVVASGVDSLLFPLVAFGTPLLWPIVFGQFTAKIAGGYIWSLVLRPRTNEWEQRNRELYGTLGR